jgi:DNA-binding NarL/FixJ family response regulator
VATILLCGVDVFFRGKLEALLPGHHFVTSDSADWPDLVIADISRVDPDDVADSYPDVPIVGFGGHTDTAGLRRAHEAGFDQVLVKNALQERAPQIVEELIAQQLTSGVRPMGLTPAFEGTTQSAVDARVSGPDDVHHRRALH